MLEYTQHTQILCRIIHLQELFLLTLLSVKWNVCFCFVFLVSIYFDGPKFL